MQQVQTLETDRILPGSAVEEKTSLSRSTIWRLERDGKFPKKCRLSANRVGWLQSEIMAWLQERAS